MRLNYPNVASHEVMDLTRMDHWARRGRPYSIDHKLCHQATLGNFVIPVELILKLLSRFTRTLHGSDQAVSHTVEFGRSEA